jgi:gliding motility-associated-like protein
MRNLLLTLSLLIYLSFPDTLLGQGWQWAKGSTGGGIDSWPVATDLAGNVYAAGVTFGTGGAVSLGGYTVPYSPGSQVVLAKYDPNGNFLWALSTKNTGAWLINIATDPSGNVFLLGTFDNSSLQIGSFTLNNTTTYEQYFLAKISPAGSVIWAVNAGNAEYGATAGLEVVLGLGGLATDAAGNAYVVVNFTRPSVTIGAYTLYNADPSGNSDDIMVAKYDPVGNVIWATSIGGTGNDDAYGCTVTPAGDIYIAGNFASPSITMGASVITNTRPIQICFIGRLDASGSPVWAASSGGTSNDYAVGIASDASSNVYMTGSFKESSISFNGTAINNPTPDWLSLYLVKFDPSNNVLWSKTIYSESPYDPALQGGAWGYSIAISKCGSVWVAGAMKGDSVNIEGRSVKAPATSPDPIFIAGYDASGNYVGAGALPSGGDDQSGIACDATGNVYLCSDNWRDTMVVGSDSLVADSATELMYVAKFPYINQDSVVRKHTYTSFCLGQNNVMTATPGYANYSWSNGQTGNTYTATDSGLYLVKSSLNCKAFCTDSFEVRTDCECTKSLFVPNAFTPNGDGQDDIFYPRSGVDVKEIRSFRVYDRWGQLMFSRENIMPNDASNAWDGTYKNQKPLPDVYVWTVDATCENGVLISKKGSVTIIR